MTTTINKKASAQAPAIATTSESDGNTISIEIDGDDNATISIDVDDKDLDEGDDTDDNEEKLTAFVEVDFDEERGTAAIVLENGNTYVLSEPPTKQFLYFTSWIETAEPALKSNSMSVFWLSHAMITQVIGPDEKAIAKPDFDEFLDSLGDSDIERVGAAFTCFPDVMARYTRIYKNMVGRKRPKVS
jgi:hypothetical protein